MMERSTSSGLTGRHLLEQQFVHVCLCLGVFYGHADQVSISIKIDINIFVNFSGFMC